MLHIYIYIPKWNLFSLYNVICMYVFLVDQLVLGNQLMYFFFGKNLDPMLSIFWLPVVFCGGLMSLDVLSSSHFSLSAVVLFFSSCLGNHFGDMLLVSILTVLGDTISQQTLTLWLLESFHPLFCNIAEVTMYVRHRPQRALKWNLHENLLPEDYLQWHLQTQFKLSKGKSNQLCYPTMTPVNRNYEQSGRITLRVQ